MTGFSVFSYVDGKGIQVVRAPTVKSCASRLKHANVDICSFAVVVMDWELGREINNANECMALAEGNYIRGSRYSSEYYNSRFFAAAFAVPGLGTYRIADDSVDELIRQFFVSPVPINPQYIVVINHKTNREITKTEYRHFRQRFRFLAAGTLHGCLPA